MLSSGSYNATLGMEKQQRYRAGVIGLGAMGKHHVRVLRTLHDAYELVAVHDADTKLCQQTAESAGVHAAADLAAVLERAEVVFVATPTHTHHAIARTLLQAGRHVFVEKPIAATQQQAVELADLANAKKLRLVSGHTERFNPVVEWLRTRLRGEEVLSINIERVGPRPPRIRDVGIITDLAVHDLDLLQFLSGSRLSRVRCVSRATAGEFEDVAQIIADTDRGVVCSITTNWLTPYKSREISVATRKGVFRGDLMRNIGRFYAGIDEDASRIAVEETVVRWKEPLIEQARAFREYLRTGEPLTIMTGRDAAEVVHWVETALADSRVRSAGK